MQSFNRSSVRLQQLKTEAYLIIVAIIATVLFLIVDIYIMVFYTHRDEPIFSAVSIFCKILIVLTLLQTQLQPLMLILDVASSRDSDSDLTTLWLVLYFSLLCNLAFVKPIANFLYERDHDDPCWKTTLWTFFEIITSLGVFGLFFGLAWSFWGEIAMPVDFIEIDAAAFSIEASSQAASESDLNLHFSSSLICFVVAFFCLLGYPIVACCGACGLTVLPISLIVQFLNRPKFRRTSDATQISQFLKVETVRLLRQSQKLKRQAEKIERAQGFFQKRDINNKFQKKMKAIQQEIQLHKDFYELFKMELDMKEVNPIVFIMKLIGGVISIVLSVLLWIQMQVMPLLSLMAQLIYPISSGHPSIFLDSVLNYLQNNNANFVSIGLLMVIAFYLTLSIVKGVVFFSSAVPFMPIHPIIQGKTWLNSFLFHLTLCSLGAASLLHLLTSTFPYYLRGGSISVVLDILLTNMKVLGFLLEKHVFTYCFLIIGVLGMVYVTFKMICGGQSKGELLKRIQAKRLKLFGKEGQNKSLKYIEMTEMSLKTPLLTEQKKKKQGK